MSVEKRGYRIPISLEMEAALLGGPTRKSHREPVSPTPEQVAEHTRARVALEELENNPWVIWPRMDDEIVISDLPTHHLVYDETHEEYMARLQEWKEGRA